MTLDPFIRFIQFAPGDEVYWLDMPPIDAADPSNIKIHKTKVVENVLSAEEGGSYLTVRVSRIRQMSGDYYTLPKRAETTEVFSSFEEAQDVALSRIKEHFVKRIGQVQNPIDVENPSGNPFVAAASAAVKMIEAWIKSD